MSTPSGPCCVVLYVTGMSRPARMTSEDIKVVIDFIPSPDGADRWHRAYARLLRDGRNAESDAPVVPPTSRNGLPTTSHPKRPEELGQ